MGLLIFVLVIAPIILGLITGIYIESRHYADIERRERQFLQIPAIVGDILPLKDPDVFLVGGSVVIAYDAFKGFVASLQNLIGGRHKSLETLVDRARREAVLRMKEEAQSGGAIGVAQVRIETIFIGGGIEAFAYGTAYRR